jgi:hypothetical protein
MLLFDKAGSLPVVFTIEQKINQIKEEKHLAVLIF